MTLTLENGEKVDVYFSCSSQINVKEMKEYENIIFITQLKEYVYAQRIRLYIEELKKDEDYFKKLSLVIFGDA